jgi:outer membrane protein OmpA-like peptidoglycan-associated protein
MEDKMNKKHIALLSGVAILAGLLSFTGCATKKMVQTELAALDQKVEGVATSVEENQKRLKEHDEKLAAIGTLIAQQESQFKGMDGRIEEVKKLTQGKLIYKETVRNSEAKFIFDSYEISAEGKAGLDKFVEVLVTQNRGVYLEIQGHTDNAGPEVWNRELGLKRADAVMEYLYKQHHIPLHRMQVISFGSSAPVADNGTPEGRAQNRRVDILVYE